MTRSDFLLLVQTRAIVYDLTKGRSLAAQVLEEAIAWPESLFATLEPIEAGCYTDYQYGYSWAERPPWMPGDNPGGEGRG